MLALVMTVLLAQVSTPTQTPTEALVEKVVERAQAAMTLRQAQRVQYKKSFLLEDVGDEHRPKKKETKEWDIWWDADGGHERLICKNDKEVKNGEVAKAGPDLVLLLGSHFKVALIDPPNPPEVECDGAPCAVISFQPKDPDLPADSDEGAVLNHMAGIAYVDTKHHYLVYVKGHLYQQFSMKVVGTIKRVYAEMWYRRNHDGMPMLARSVSEVFYTKFWVSNVVERRTYEYGEPR